MVLATSTPHVDPVSPPTADRRAACPGLLRVVPSRDGGICRIKLPLGRLAAAQARAVARVARDYRTGAIEFTNRANVQIRGIDPAAEAALVAPLLDAGLGPLAEGGDDVRNVMIDPAHGLDPGELVDLAPLGERLLDRLQREPRYHVLSPKFSIQLDGGGAVAATDHPHDLWLAAGRVGATVTLALGVASAVEDGPIALVPEAAAFDAIMALLDLFLGRAALAGGTRFRDLLATMPRAEIAARLDGAATDVGTWRRAPVRRPGPIGVFDQRQAGFVYVGAAPTVGRLSPAMLEGLAAVAERAGDGTLRLTPWQGAILPNLRRADAGDALDTLQGLGFTIEATSPFARMVACAGSTGCASGLADTKGDARALADRLGGAVDVHLSGCIKSCASARVAEFTLLAVAPGRYDLYQRGAGGHRFGEKLRGGVTVAEAASALESFR